MKLFDQKIHQNYGFEILHCGHPHEQKYLWKKLPLFSHPNPTLDER